MPIAPGDAMGDAAIFPMPLDLLDQIREAVPRDHPLHAHARKARDLVDRGIVAYSATA